MDHIRLWLMAGVISLASCTGGGQFAPARISDPPALPQTVSEAAPRPKCGRVNIATRAYGTEIRPRQGPPGTLVTLTGTTVRGEDWKWAASQRLEAWWNTKVPRTGLPLKEGPSLHLLTVTDMKRCWLSGTFRVPETKPGRYRISVFTWEKNPADGYGLGLPHHFTVTGH